MRGYFPALRIFCASPFWAGVLLLSGSMSYAGPEIGISFPPVSAAEHRAFTTNALRPIGVTHIRFADNWRRRGLQPDFAPLQRRMTALRQAGFTILLTVQSDGPDAACAARNTHSCLITEDAPLEVYLEGLLTAVGDDLDAIQFGNEWDNQFVGTAEEFLALHQRFASVVRRNRPDLPIVLGGVTGRAAYAQVHCVDQAPVSIPGIDLEGLSTDFCIGDADRNRRTISDVRYVLGHADYDIADIHLDDVNDLWLPATRWISSVAGGRPIWVTEFGGPAPDLEPQDPAYQAQRLARYLTAIANLPIARAYYFKLTDDDTSVHDRSGLYDRRGQPKLALDVFTDFITGDAYN
ncbi:hypothetical protein [Yoonia sp. I 8.24]|uniref:hypothetical protein n=1 Tax=Yoonia sp. I 8.24 TaxID=1537229 RepID=UPI001EE0C35D|nr:hypothetical protein [Yoonia sp. I 8.24]MCG3266843.1 hypothetical protein [Yoonia sp. I 8.24]